MPKDTQIPEVGDYIIVCVLNNYTDLNNLFGEKMIIKTSGPYSDEMRVQSTRNNCDYHLYEEEFYIV